MINPDTGDVIENLNGETMFAFEDMNPKGDVPGEFRIEMFNFNPHRIMGDFIFFDSKIQLLQSSQGFFMDRKSRRVNKHGWMTLAGQGHLVDIHGRKKFDKN